MVMGVISIGVSQVELKWVCFRLLTVNTTADQTLKLNKVIYWYSVKKYNFCLGCHEYS